jgi:dTDP-4-amino-4,6-dideoxygalactose transaminase
MLESVSGKDKTRSSIANYVISESKLNHVSSSKKGIGVHWQNIVYVKNPERFMRYMRKKGVDTAQSSLILLSELPAYGWTVTTENAKHLYENGVYLPCYSSLSSTESKHLVKVLNEYDD